MSAIGKGDWVQCIWAPPHPIHGNALRLGGVYCVEWVGFGFSMSRRRIEPGIRVVDDVVPWPDCWDVEQFKPLSGNARALKAPPINAPAKSREDA